MRILFVSQLFDPEYSIKGLSLMKYWVEQGYEVEVLTTFPNYPLGKVFDGYKLKLKTVEMHDGVKVVRLWSYISHSKSKASRAFSYLSFIFMALFYALFSRKPDIVYGYHPQITTGIVGVLLKKIKKTKFITDVQDLWPDSLVALGVKKNSSLVKAIDWWVDKIYLHADKVVVLSEGFKKSLIDRGVDAEKISVIYNWCPEEELIEKTLVRSTYEINNLDALKLVYAGNVGSVQGLQYVIDAVSFMSEKELIFDIYGGGVELEKLKEYVRNKKISNVNFLGFLPPSELFYRLCFADILLVHLIDDDLFKITIPSKTQSCMALAKPILMAVGGEANDIVNNAVAGFVASPGSVASIRLAIIEALNNSDQWSSMGTNSRNCYMTKFSTKVNYKNLDEVLRSCMNVHA
ncbi:MAG: glycosyltransferase family 4 protein [Nitrincola lacisaponensis]|uniref:glycosyltransferase family 4 protein n=1 Tax=Nitrincola lacisaponensis TaxID=267850 RepID=UPI00391A0B88